MKTEGQGRPTFDDREGGRPVAPPERGLRASDQAPGLSIRFVRDYDISSDFWPAQQLDVVMVPRDEPVEREGVPCAFCIRMVGRHCREYGCLREAYYAGLIPPDSGFEWDPPNVDRVDDRDLHRFADDGGPCLEGDR